MHRSDVFSQIPLPHSCVITRWALLSFSPTVFLFHMGCDCRPPPWVQTFCFKKKSKNALTWICSRSPAKGKRSVDQCALPCDDNPPAMDSEKNK